MYHIPLDAELVTANIKGFFGISNLLFQKIFEKIHFYMLISYLQLTTIRPLKQQYFLKKIVTHC